MRYMGINNIEDYIYHVIHDFRTKNPGRKIIRIMVGPEAYEELEKLTRMYTLPSKGSGLAGEWPPLTYNGVPVHLDARISHLILVPEGSLSEVLYD